MERALLPAAFDFEFGLYSDPAALIPCHSDRSRSASDGVERNLLFLAGATVKERRFTAALGAPFLASFARSGAFSSCGTVRVERTLLSVAFDVDLASTMTRPSPIRLVIPTGAGAPATT